MRSLRRRSTVAVAGLSLLLTSFAATTSPLAGSAATSATHPASAALTHEHLVRVAAHRAITVTAPRRVDTGTRFRITGTVRLHGGTRRAKRPVRLAEQTTAGTWRTTAAKASTATGRFAFTVAAGARARTRTFRVVAPRHRGLKRVATQRTVRVVRALAVPTPPAPTPPGPSPVTPYAPAGDPNDWTFLYDGGARWNPCRTITWAYNPARQTYDALGDVKRSFDLVSAQTGIQFVYLGLSDRVPVAATGTPTPGAAIHVAWATRHQIPAFQGSTVGLGGSTAVYRGRPDLDASYEVVDGYLLFSTHPPLRPGFDVAGTATWGQVMTHELLHVLGLGHARGAEQLMAPGVSALNHRLGAGDLTGMTRVGATRGCLG
ncbi:hypothetical protein J2S59_002075 [Nocardioides massiliensis]|uniref:Matrixin family metalloprotease n=3 Tax=Nocardioides massiliensis TaxID=1325935 RepID=A0ABT9NPA6_9ACTN|nr:hypothetical protein [Nocardioides massiliensis]MDP9822266.1 hypothetical protein [Nocardioides massiliensis]